MFTTLKRFFPGKTSPPTSESIALKEQGDAFLKRGELDDAARRYRDALSLSPDYAEACVNLGFILEQQRQYGEADSYLRRAISIDPDVADAHYILGTISRGQHDPEGAIRHFTKALLLKPDFEEAYRDLYLEFLHSGQIESARNIISRAISTFPDSAEFQFHLGNLLILEEYPDVAVQPTSQELSSKQDNVLGKKAQLDQALACYRKALSLRPDYVDAHLNLGNILLMRGQLAEAHLHYSTAIALTPGCVEAHVGAGDAFDAQGKPEKALACYRQAIALTPDLADVHVKLGGILQRYGEQDVALSHYERAIALSPDCVEAHVGAGRIFRAQNKLDEALACFHMARSLKSDDASVNYFLGGVLRDRGNIDEAIACLQLAVELEPNNVQVLNGLGTAFLTKGEREEALSCFRRAVALQPENPVAHLITALTGSNSERAPSEYIEGLFDQYADRFDTHLVQSLRYNIPQQLVDLIRQVPNCAFETWNVLDLGCGTGLVGAAFASHARMLVGVDLSAKMLAKAKVLNLYHRLEKSDLVAMMQRETASSYDLVIAADVFVYLGKLDEVASQAQRLLRPGGLFAFHVEALDRLAGEAIGQGDQQDYRLNKTGRYAHSIAYLDRMSSDNRFEIVNLESTHCRVEENKPVQAYLALWRRPTDDSQGHSGTRSSRIA